MTRSTQMIQIPFWLFDGLDTFWFLEDTHISVSILDLGLFNWYDSIDSKDSIGMKRRSKMNTLWSINVW